jgi:hypothetical protein
MSSLVAHFSIFPTRFIAFIGNSLTETIVFYASSLFPLCSDIVTPFMRLPFLARQIAPFCFIVFLLPRSLDLVCFRVRDVVILPTSLLKPFSGHKYLEIRDGFHLRRRGQYSSPFSTESCLSIYTSLLIMLFRLRRHLCLLSRSTFLIV